MKHDINTNKQFYKKVLILYLINNLINLIEVNVDLIFDYLSK